MLPVAWMIHTVSVKRRVGLSADGSATPTFSALSTIKARVEKKARVVRGRDGKDVMLSHQMVTLTKVLYDDQFWFPSIGGEAADNTASDDDARSPQLIDVATNKAGVEVMWTVGFV